MKNKDDRPEQTAPSASSGQDLRRQAEEITRGKEAQSPEDLEALSSEETRQTLHELRVHQIELEMQNDELRRRQVELDAERARYFDFYDLTPVGYCTVSEKGLILEANLTIATMLGVARGTLVKQPISRFILKEDQDIYYRHRKKLFETGKPQAYELRMLKKDGTAFWARQETTAAQDTDGAPTCRIVMSNITERKQTEEALQKSEEKYRLLVENANETILVIQDGIVKFVNSRAVASFGYSEQEFLSIPVFEFIHPDDRDTVMERYRQKINGDTAPTRHTYRTIHKSGRIQWIEISSVLIEWECRPATMNLVTDITEQLKAEEEKRSLEAQLIQAQKMEAIGTLAGGIAHDFNNLLMGIQGYASLMLLDLDPSHPHYERLKRIEEQVRSGADLTKQLLGFARGGRYEVKPADMNDILEKSSSMFGRTKKEISIHRKYGKDLWTVEVDQGQMEQVFMNLYVNAWQAMPGGGGIYLETENVLLDNEQAFPYAVSPGKYVKISVTDTGTGMDEKTRGRIFDPFFTTKEMGKGTGLGLTTVYGIIKGHKGMIHVDSEPGQGATFTIHLPASEKQLVEAKTATGTIARGTETILLVDDEKMVLEVNKDILEFLGYQVYAVESGQEALAVYMEKQKEIELVILDMLMPGMSGGETFDRLREINPGIKVLLSSGYSINGKAQTIMDRGCNGFLQKPFRMEELSHKVREMLD